MNRCTHDRRGLLLGSRGCACTNRWGARRVHRISCRNEVYPTRERFGKRPTTQTRWAAFSSPRFSREAKFGPSRFRTARGVNPDEWLGRGRHRSRKAVALRAIWKLFRTKSASRKLNLTDLKLEDIATGVFTPVLARHSKSFLLIDCISIGVDRMQRNFKPMRRRVELWRKSDLTDVTAKAVIYGVCGGPTGCSQAPGPHLCMIATSR